MKTYVLCVLAGFMLVTPSLVAQNSETASPTIPEEARRHFVMGEMIFKEAKNADAFSLAAAEFTEAARLAPQWPDARYDLALAKEAAGDYSGAMADLKLYQQFKLTDAEARTVQDKIYAIEAKQKMAVDEANSPAVQLEKLIKSLDGGVWRCVRSTNDNNIGGHFPDADAGHTYIAVSGHTINGYSFVHVDYANYVNGAPTIVRDVSFDPNAKPVWTVILTSRKFNAPLPANTNNTDWSNKDRYNNEVTISDDGRSITESIAYSDHDSGGSYEHTITRTYTRDR
jgi:tetratricopeptide (TPR) repeat protein